MGISIAFGSLQALQLASGMLPEKKSTSGLLVEYQVELRTSGLKSCFQGGICVCLGKECSASLQYFTILGNYLLNK